MNHVWSAHLFLSLIHIFYKRKQAGTVYAFTTCKYGIKAVSYTHLDVYKRQARDG